jgi:glyoxylase-like metal-dependent hydrolase (beta-lactamase superfamily II)
MPSSIGRLRRTARPLSVAAFLAALAALAACSRSPTAPPTDRAWRVFAIEYGESTVARSMLVRGAPKGERAPMAWYAWLLVSKTSVDRRILVDTGFDDAARAKKWRFTRRDRVSAILDRTGVAPASITDVVLTHGHWDHVGDTAPYVGARFWIQKAALSGLHLRVRLTALDGPKEIANGVTLVPGGGHAPGIQWVKIALGDANRRTVAVASDVAYLYENIEKPIPTGSTSDPDADLAATRDMLSATGSAALILPGHDPLVAKRLARVCEDVYELK